MPKPRNGPLTVKQKRFIEEYLVDLNGAAAARRAGYEEKYAKQSAARLLYDPRIKPYIDEGLKEKAKKSEMNRKDVIEGLCKIALFDVRRLFNSDGNLKKISEIDDFTAGAIAGIEVVSGGEISTVTKIKVCDRRGALVDIGKDIGMFINRSEIGKPGEFDELSDEELDDINRQADAEASRRSEGDQEGPVFIPPVH